MKFQSLLFHFSLVTALVSFLHMLIHRDMNCFLILQIWAIWSYLLKMTLRDLNID